jgi:hypothetical protein
MARNEWSREALESVGFSGWHQFSKLRNHVRDIGPTAGGVYVVYRNSNDAPTWLEKSTGGTWRGDPSVETNELASNWHPDANIVYIGKANEGQLRNRLRALCSFGEGGRGRHYGGRYIWQLADSSELLVAWRTFDVSEGDPYEIEQEMIADFIDDFQQRPFANLNGGQRLGVPA